MKSKLNPVAIARYIFIILVLCGLIFIISTGSDMAYAHTALCGLAWMIFEQWVVLQNVIAIQQMIVNATQPKAVSEKETQKKTEV